MLLANYGNSQDPRNEADFRHDMIHDHHDIINGRSAIKAAEDRRAEWVRGFIIGAPIATDIYTSQELADQGTDLIVWSRSHQESELFLKKWLTQALFDA